MLQFYGVLDDSLDEAIDLFRDRRDAEHVVEYWDRDEPEQADYSESRSST